MSDDAPIEPATAVSQAGFLDDLTLDTDQSFGLTEPAKTIIDEFGRRAQHERVKSSELDQIAARLIDEWGREAQDSACD